ncbi:helix-turn-helix transcriptional regulator [Clostridium sp. D2Q-11]|uniref:Helix-turn-helix transcriptional regulator n=1 Tax=Anaeromonas frigoriresistens TaxID=2683708 RepID=A0A942UXW5_9FIRM|nr:helix-turn-helix transcriptional regulator [Anaeromonas frigoriresistens]MBS4537627.1 helix-turn-helix transcriptional regulator [Anaeromonas frigoriresistens]
MKKTSEIWRDILPIFILSILTKGEVQSNRIYDIIEKVFININRSSAYSTINFMIIDELIEGIFLYKEDKGIKYYRLTDKGNNLLSNHKEDLLIISNALEVIMKSYY